VHCVEATWAAPRERKCSTLIFIRILNLPTNAFHLNNKLIALHFMACIFSFLSPRLDFAF
jgi:hypothetical protein